jgi:hypothetical protein
LKKKEIDAKLRGLITALNEWLPIHEVNVVMGKIFNLSEDLSSKINHLYLK